MIFIRTLFFSFLFVLIACEDKPYQKYPVAKGYQRPETPTLHHEEAKLRSLTVKNIEYYLHIDLTKSKRYSGFVEIKLDYTPSPFPLTIDFVAGEAEQINVNNNIIPITYAGNFISIPSEQLEAGTNIIKVQFSHAYSDNGNGLYRFTDPLDDKTYLYSNFEPYYANRLFPLFDQPDMLSTYKLKVITPKEWVVVSSVKESEIIEDGPYKRWHFPQSPEISSHSISLHAGSWHIWEGKSGKTPLRLMVRQAMAKKIDVREWFKTTQLGIQFFSQYLSMTFPYAKYDQLVVPDANVDGSVNTGGAIFSEQLIVEGMLTADIKNAIATVIFREISKMWFSNQLTIYWWHDLWIRESLANYLAPLALAETSEDEDTWNNFFIHSKSEAYKTDLSMTSVPVYRQVADSKNAVANLDENTTTKGAAIIQQLSYYLGENTFRNGLRRFINNFQYKSSDQNDFFTIMKDTSGTQLNDWIKTWVNTAGINTLSAKYQCKNNKIIDFAIIQTAPENFSVMREQLLQVALYAKIEGQIKATTISAVSIQDEITEIKSFVGQPCPLLVYPNYGNWGYVNVELDQHTLQMLTNNIIQIDEPLARAMFWHALWQQVVDLKLPLNQYLDQLFNYLAAETDTKVISALLSNLSKANNWINKISQTDLKSKTIIESFEDLFLRKIQLVEDGSDEQKIWFHYFIKIAQTDDSLNYLSKWLQSKRQPTALNSEPEFRWAALVRLSIFNHADLEPLLKLEQFYDKSEQALMMLLAVQASRPDPEIKNHWLDQLVREKDRLTAAKLKHIMKYLFPSEQSNIHHLFAAKIFQNLHYIDAHRDQEIVSAMVNNMLPIFCNSDSIALLKEKSDNMSELSLLTQNAIKEAQQKNERCLAINRLMTQSSSTKNTKTLQ
ncbi:MAG: aminopeptidase N [Gammaproteobacteria bacterium]|nr:aminopeptidase N [Gammaproteobacteria bacterium]